VELHLATDLDSDRCVVRPSKICKTLADTTVSPVKKRFRHRARIERQDNCKHHNHQHLVRRPTKHKTITDHIPAAVRPSILTTSPRDPRADGTEFPPLPKFKATRKFSLQQEIHAQDLKNKNLLRRFQTDRDRANDPRQRPIFFHQPLKGRQDMSVVPPKKKTVGPARQLTWGRRSGPSLP